MSEDRPDITVEVHRKIVEHHTMTDPADSEALGKAIATCLEVGGDDGCMTTTTVTHVVVQFDGE